MRVLANCKKMIDNSKVSGGIFFEKNSVEEIVKIVDTYCILNNSEPIFISTNGSSINDLCPMYGKIVSHYNHDLTTKNILNSSQEHQKR